MSTRLHADSSTHRLTSFQVKWTAANDRKLLLLGLQREIIPKEHAAIAASFLGTLSYPHTSE